MDCEPEGHTESIKKIIQERKEYFLKKEDVVSETTEDLEEIIPNFAPERTTEEIEDFLEEQAELETLRS